MDDALLASVDIPLEADGSVVGGVGVSGGALEEDVAVATAAVEAFEER